MHSQLVNLSGILTNRKFLPWSWVIAIVLARNVNLTSEKRSVLFGNLNKRSTWGLGVGGGDMKCPELASWKFETQFSKDEELIGLTFQPNCKFSDHVRLKLTKANKCLHILRTLQKELFSQKEIDHLFKTLVLPILTYGLAVYGASDSDLNVIQRFLDRCHKRHFTSQTVSIFNLLEQQDKSAFKRAINNHMLGAIIPKEKELVYNLRRRRCHLPQIKTEKYKKTFANRLIFKYNLV